MTFLQLTLVMVPTWSLIAKGGIGHQVVKNFYRKSTKGISIPFYVAGMIAYGWFTVLGFLTHSVSVVTAQLPGIVLDAIVIMQALYYRKEVPVLDEDWMQEIERILQ